MEASRWLSILFISIVISLLPPTVISGSSKFGNGAPGTLNLNLPLTAKELRRLKAKGLEVVPSDKGSITSNSVTSEPTCEELRAMWRYYKRQSRAAELTNQIPQIQLPDLFWDVPTAQQPSSFGPLRTRTRPRFRMHKGPPKNALYGRILMSPQKENNNKNEGRKPVEEVVRILGPTTNNKNLLASNDRVLEPTLHLAPPVEPTPESGFQKLRNIYRNERLKEHQAAKGVEIAADNSNSPPLVSNSKDFGKLILTPPQGQDGRVANKPKELMSPFEKLRFHSDDVLGITDEIDGRHNMMSNFMSKRRNGFIGIPMLTPLDRSRHLPQQPVKGNSRNSNSNSNKNNGNNEKNFKAEETKGWGSDNSGLITGSEDSIDETLIPSGDYSISLDNSGEESGAILIRTRPEVENPPCSVVENQGCFTNSDCACVGFGFYRCYMAQCQILSFIPTESAGAAGMDELNDGSGIWHRGPIADKHLGAWEQSGGAEIKKKFS